MKCEINRVLETSPNQRNREGAHIYVRSSGHGVLRLDKVCSSIRLRFLVVESSSKRNELIASPIVESGLVDELSFDRIRTVYIMHRNLRRLTQHTTIEF